MKSVRHSLTAASYKKKNLAKLLDAKREIDNVARKKRSVPVHLDMNINDNLTGGM